MTKTTEAPLTPEAFARAANVSRETMARLETYAALLAKFQTAVNLVSSDTLKDVWHRHFLDSAQIFPLLPKPPAGRPLRLLDLGSGAGFPGLVLAILASGTGMAMETRLVEADRRKAAFLREVARRTDTAVSVENRRLENLPPGPVDVVTARAFAPLDRLLTLLEPFLIPAEPAENSPSGPTLLLLKGRSAAEELTRAREGWKMQVSSIPSVTDTQAVVLRIEELRRV